MNKSLADILKEHGRDFLSIPLYIRDNYMIEEAKESTYASIDDKHIILTKLRRDDENYNPQKT